jgi:hypothetical protein
MLPRIVLIGLTGLLIGAATPELKTKTQFCKDLQGSWDFVLHRDDRGNEYDACLYGFPRLVVRGQSMRESPGGTCLYGVRGYRLDPYCEKAIDIIEARYENGKYNENNLSRYPAIYCVDGDTLRIAVDYTRRHRPKKFPNDFSPDFDVYIFKRVHP